MLVQWNYSFVLAANLHDNHSILTNVNCKTKSHLFEIDWRLSVSSIRVEFEWQIVKTTISTLNNQTNITIAWIWIIIKNSDYLASI